MIGRVPRTPTYGRHSQPNRPLAAAGTPAPVSVVTILIESVLPAEIVAVVLLVHVVALAPLIGPQLRMSVVPFTLTKNCLP